MSLLENILWLSVAIGESIKRAIGHLSACLVGNFVKLCYKSADAKFGVVKASSTQLFGVHAFVKSGSGVKQVPLAFCLMSGKRKQDYIDVINSIIQLLSTPLAVRRMVLYFEAALWEAIHVVDTPLWEAIRVVDTPLWEAIRVVDTPLWEAIHVVDTPLWEAIRVVDTPLWEAIRVVDTPLWEAIHVVDTPLWEAIRVVDTPLWEAIRVVDTPSWEAIRVVDTPSWEAIRVVDTPS